MHHTKKKEPFLLQHALYSLTYYINNKVFGISEDILFFKNYRKLIILL